MEEVPLIEGKLTSWRHKMTIEPMTLLFFIGISISQNLQLNIMLDKACTVYNVEGDYCESETDSELLISEINSWKLFFLTLFSVIFTFSSGPVIDRNPKSLRYILMVPVIGHLVCDFLNVFSAYFWSWHPAFMALYDALIVGFTGSGLGFSVIAASFMSYTSSKKERTVKIGLVTFFINFGFSIGYLVGGYATEYLGYIKCFSLCVCLHALAIIAGMICLNDVDASPQKLDEGETAFEKVKQNFRVLVKERKNSRQLVIVLCVFLYPLVVGYPVGELSVLYLFLRHEFNWDAVEYGVYMSFKMVIISAGALVCTELLKRRMKLHDATIGIIGCTLQLVVSFLWIIIRYSWQVYAITVIGAFEKAIAAVLMSLASKCVEPYEYGRLFSLFGLTYAVSPVLYPVYNTVFNSGIYTFPSAIFLVSLCLCTPCLLVFCVLRYFSEKLYEKEYHYKEIIPKQTSKEVTGQP